MTPSYGLRLGRRARWRRAGAARPRARSCAQAGDTEAGDATQVVQGRIGAGVRAAAESRTRKRNGRSLGSGRLGRGGGGPPPSLTSRGTAAVFTHFPALVGPRRPHRV